MQLIPFLVIVLGVIWIWESARWILVLLLLLAAGFFIHFYTQGEKAREEQEALQRASQQREEEEQRQLAANTATFKEAALQRIAHHRKTLARKANQSIYKDDYGQYVFDKWFSERDYFISSVLLSECPGLFSHVDEAWVKGAVADAALSVADEGELIPPILPDKMSPIEFEHFCAALLRESGWETRVTPATGDQGVDIVAEFGDLKAVFQCKLYTNPVGNAAVQEIIAGRQFERAQVAGVITNNTFTPSARQLAAAANIHLLHFSELTDLLTKLQPSSIPSNT